ncbi:chymotrypsin-1-like [Vespa crabro]|uniref:chymotrypsin-1-like n=1 Tax=Vespa crabro TaxID=7445 RepID=UPI001F006A72|nr:chymotrypsin-1-like [Vespa crabro]
MARRNFPIVVCLLAAVIGAVHGEAPEALVGASLAKDNEFPYLVSIRLNNYLHCGGAIIDEYHILTAAHCIVPLLSKKPGEVTIVTGTNNLYSGGQLYKPKLYVAHPDYDSDKAWVNDIGVIKLSSAIQFNDRVKPIALPNTMPPVNVQALIGAWGATSSPPRNISPLLRTLKLKLLSQKECQRFFKNITIHSNQICTLVQRNVGTCSGDSGSPLAYNNHVIGVVSGGIPCAQGIPDIFTNVYSHLSFISDALSR